MKFRPFLSFTAFAALILVLVFDNQRAILTGASIAAASAFAACLFGIQGQVAAGVKHIDWGDITTPFILMWIGLYQIAKVV